MARDLPARRVGLDLTLVVTAMLVATACTTGSPPSSPMATATSPSSPPVRDDLPWIAYQAYGPQGYGVQLVKTDGSGSRPAAAEAGGSVQEHPDWTLDGRQMVFAVTSGETEDLWLLDVAAWTVAPLIDCEAPCIWVDEPAWAPDGRSIVYQRLTQDGSAIRSTLEVIDVRTRKIEVLATLPLGRVVLAPRWSPDGSRLVVELLRLGEPTLDSEPVGGTIGVLDRSADSTIRELLPEDQDANNPDWSPVDDLIVFSAPVEGGEPGGDRSDLWTIHSDGTGLTQVTRVAERDGYAIHPTFTPDGSGIVFAYGETDGATGRIAVVDRDGSAMGPATTSGYIEGTHPRLQPIRP